ncbi:MAG: type II/IV secretion system ATPase subunit [Thermoplasmatales archaeon]|nr:MAG: type II/IV secretion system ATPase subunit [Thermoplasmatales archaeon]
MKEDTIGNKNSLSSSKNKDILEIEKAVDKILLGNIGKLISKEEKQHSNKTDLESFNVNFSPKNRKKESIFFIRNKKKSIEKEEKGTDSGKSDVKLEKLNKKSVEVSDSTTKTRKRSSVAGLKKRFAFGKTKKETMDLSKKTTKELSPSVEDKSHYQLDESLEKLNQEETRWLDQQIKASDTVIDDQSKKVLNNINPVEPVSSQKDMLDKPKHIEKRLGRIRRNKVISKREPKKFFSSKHIARTPKSYRERTAIEETKPALLSKEFRSKKKHPSIPEGGIPSLGRKYRHSFLRKTKHKKASAVTPDKLDAQDKQHLMPPQELQYDTYVSTGEILPLDEVQALKSTILKNLGYSEGTWEELDFYHLQEPFAYVEIIRDKETLDKRYILVEVELSKEELQLLDFLKDTLTGFSIDTKELEEKGEKKYLIDMIEQILEDYMLEIDTQIKKKIFYFLEKQFLGLHKLEVLMRDPNIEDISCDGSNVPIFLYHRRYGSLKGNIQFDNEDELSAFVIKLAQKCGKHISIAEPMLDATMPDGSRIQMTLSTEVTTKGSTFTIRKFKEDPFSPPDLIEFNTMSSEMIAYMWMAVENGINALIAGGTAAGKTSTLNALSLFVPKEAKIVSIEETREINLPHPNWIPGVARSGFGEVVGNKIVGEIDLYDLMKAALRQRPEYILVGEIRGREAYVLFQAMATGHTTYSTVHADSAQSLIHRLEGKPINIPRIMLQALDIVCIQIISRVKNKRARRCKQVIEIIDIDPSTKEILTNEVFRWDPVEDKFIYSGKSYILERIRAEKDIGREDITNEIKNRAKLLDWMNKNNVREFKKVANLISQYFENPTKLIGKIMDES